MLEVSRRGLLALGGTGAAGVALSACGDAFDPRAGTDDATLLGDALAAEATLQAAYDNLSAGVVAGAEGAEVVNLSRDASSQRQQELGRLGASTPTGGASTTGGGGDENGFTGAETAANDASAAYREGAGLLSTTDLRAPVAGFLAQVAAELATIRGLFDADQVPAAFVTGGAHQPYVAADDSSGDETTSDSSTTSSSTTSTTTEP